MSVTSVSEQFGSRRGAVNNKGERTYQRTWLVECSDKEDDPKIAIAAVEISRGDPYLTSSSTDAGSVINSIDCQYLAESKYVWIVTATYGPPLEDEDSPLDEPPEYQYGSAQFSRRVVKDVYGSAILNTAGDPYSEDGHEIDDSRSTLTVRINVASFNWAEASEYRDKVNSNTWKGGRPGTVKIANVSATSQKHQNGDYWQVSYTFHHNPNGWDLNLLNEGYNELVEGKKRKITIKGKEPSEKQLLDMQGKLLAEDGQPVFRVHRVYDRVPFVFPF